MIVSQGYSLAFGARFLKRFIDEHVKLPISQQWKEGSHFDVRTQGGELVVQTAAAKIDSERAAFVYGDVA